MGKADFDLKTRIYKAILDPPITPARQPSLRNKQHMSRPNLRVQSYSQQRPANHQSVPKLPYRLALRAPTPEALKGRALLQPQKTNSTTQKEMTRTKSYREPLGVRSLGEMFKLEPSRCSKKGGVHVRAYAGNSHSGPLRNYNEDRITILPLPGNQVYYFGLFDGHGGSACSDFLRDKFHILLSDEQKVLKNAEQGLKQAVHRAELDFIQQAIKNRNRSGSCLLIALTLQDKLFVASVGDSKAVLSRRLGASSEDASVEHRPMNRQEYVRLTNSGAKIIYSRTQDGSSIARIEPGGLAVSRTIGDIESKIPQLGGNPRAVVALPSVREFVLNKECDFLLLGSDGIFDVLSRQEAVRVVWQTVLERRAADIHQQCAACAEAVIMAAVEKHSRDNLSAIVVAFHGLASLFQGDEITRLGQDRLKQSWKKRYLGSAI